MGLDELPAEILEIILSNCNKSTIWNVSLVSSGLHGPAIQNLYRHVLPADARQTISLFWALVQVPFVATYVRTLHVRAPFCLARDVFKMPASMEIGQVYSLPFHEKMAYWSERIIKATSIHQTEEAARLGASLAALPSQKADHLFDRTMNSSIPVVLIELAFRNMTSLQRLFIHSPSHPHVWTFSYESPALQHVKIHQNAASPLLLCWLAKQSALTSIEYHPDSQYTGKWFPDEGPEVESHFLPKIREIVTNIRGAILFVPGRPIESLSLHIPKGSSPEEHKQDPDTDESYLNGHSRRRFVTRHFSMQNLGRALRASARPIHKLTLAPQSTAILGPFLRLIVESIPTITHLTITVDYDHSLYPLLEEYLGSMPNLLILEIPYDHRIPAERPAQDNSAEKINPVIEEHGMIREQQLITVTKWARKAAVLQRVVMHPESPLMNSLARHSAMYGTFKYEVSILEWSISRNGPSLEITPVE